MTNLNSSMYVCVCDVLYFDECISRTVLPSAVATRHMWLFNFFFALFLHSRALTKIIIGNLLDKFGFIKDICWTEILWIEAKIGKNISDEIFTYIYLKNENRIENILHLEVLLLSFTEGYL